MEPIIEPIDRALLMSELTKERLIRTTNSLANEIYIVNGNDCPNTMKEIGRLREESFRSGGGGTGKPFDVDGFDIGPYAYEQIVVWNPTDQDIVGGYRFVKCINNRDEKGEYHLSTSEIATYSDRLKEEFFPYTIELGRSYVQPKYQPSAGSRGNIFSLDNLWDGLGAITVLHQDVQYFFGKITMYTNFNPEARDHILRFMHFYFPDADQLLTVSNPLIIQHNCAEFLESLKGLPYKEGHLLLNKKVRSFGEGIPPLFNSYMNLSPTMRTFGTAVNDHFGGVEETGILIKIEDIYESKKNRYIQSFLDYLAAGKTNNSSV